MPKFRIRKQDGRLDWGRLPEWVRSLPDGDYMLDGKPWPKLRTLDQNDYYWGVVMPICLSGMIDAGWEGIRDTKELHELYKSWFTRQTVVNKFTGTQETIPASTRGMTTKEFSAFVDMVRDYAEEYLNVNIPEPERGEKKGRR